MAPTPTAAALNSVDYFILFTFGLSMLAGYIRGFIKELVSVVTVVAAIIFSTLFADKLAVIFSGSTKAALQGAVGSMGVSSSSMDGSMSMVALGVSYLVIFLGTMFVGYIFGLLVSGLTLGMTDSLSNRLFGAVFGLVRGFLIVVVLMFLAELTTMGAQPVWLQSQLVQSLQPVVTELDKQVHPGLEKIRAQAESAFKSVQMPDVTGNVSNILNGATNGQ